MKYTSRRRAFTLIELLIVIVMVAVLAALGFYGAKVALAKSREARCISNLHQMGGAFAAYASDHNDELPTNNTQVGGYRWYLMLNPYLDKSPDATDGGWSPPSVFICPTNDPHTGDAGGGKYKLWLDYGYACNLALMPRRNDQKDASGNDVYYPNPTGRATRMATLPARHVLVGDVGKDRNQYFKSQNGGLPYGSVENARVHRRGVHLLWTDFSVSWVIAEGIVNEDGKISCWN